MNQRELTKWDIYYDFKLKQPFGLDGLYRNNLGLEMLIQITLINLKHNYSFSLKVCHYCDSLLIFIKS